MSQDDLEGSSDFAFKNDTAEPIDGVKEQQIPAENEEQQESDQFDENLSGSEHDDNEDKQQLRNGDRDYDGRSSDSEDHKKRKDKHKSQIKHKSQEQEEIIDREAYLHAYWVCLHNRMCGYSQDPYKVPDIYRDHVKNLVLKFVEDNMTNEQLGKNITRLMSSRKLGSTFFAQDGLQLIRTFFNQSRMIAATTPFPDRERADFILELLKTINKDALIYRYEDLMESNLIMHINFIAMFPLKYCPSQQLRQSAKDLLEMWKPKLKEALDNNRAGNYDIDEDEENSDQPQQRQSKSNQFYHTNFKRDDMSQQQLAQDLAQKMIKK